MAIIEIVDATKRFGNVLAVDRITLTVNDGEFMVLVGPSGCGKTTLLRMVAGLTEMTAGSVSFDGRDISAAPPGQRNVAMVFQNYALFPHMTVERNLSFGLRLRHTSGAERQRQVGEVAKLLRIEELLSRFPRELSGGQKQRVALGRALIRRPVAFLFDEPLSNLDPALRVEMRAEIAGLHSRYPVTTIYVTHDQVEAMTMGSRLAVLDQGRMMQTGTPLELYNNPQDMFTAGFIGSPAMNMLKLAVDAGSGPVSFTAKDLKLQARPDDLPGAATWPREVVLGIRPEHLSLCGPGDPGAIAARVHLVEELGREHIVHLKRDELELRLVVHGGMPPRLGEPVHAAPDWRHAFFFDPASGMRLPGS